MKSLFRIILVFIIIIAILIVGKNVFIKVAVENGVRMAMGVPLKVKKFNVGFVSTNLDIQDLSLYNPEGFPEEVMFHAPEIYVDYELKPILKGNVHLEEIRLDFDEFIIVKNKDGQLNLDALKPKEKDKVAKKANGKSGENKEKKPMEFQIDQMSLKIGKVIFKDYSKGGEPIIKESNINFSKEFTDINNKNIYMTMFSLVPRILMKANLTSLVDFKLDGVLSGATDMAVDTLKGTTNTLKDAAGTLTDKIKLPFGK